MLKEDRRLNQYIRLYETICNRYNRDKPINIMDVLRKEGREIVLDWTTEEHLSKSHKDQ